MSDPVGPRSRQRTRHTATTNLVETPTLSPTGAVPGAITTGSGSGGSSSGTQLSDGHDPPGTQGPLGGGSQNTVIVNAATATPTDLSAARETVTQLGDATAAAALERVERRAEVQVPIRARVATARGNNHRMPGEVPGILREAQGRVTFYPADESLMPFDLDPNKAKDLPRDVLLIARVTKKTVQLVDEQGNDATATLYTLRQEREARLGGRFTGIVDLVDGTPHLRDIATGKIVALPGTHDAGTVLAGHVEPGGKLVIDETVAKAQTAEARAWTLAAAQHLDPSFPVQALEEAALILAKPGLDDPSLVDRRAEPFFAINNHGSKDIDQAMRLTRRPDGGFVLQYALADMAHSVKPGMALWNEALERGASFYMPGINVPMQPRDVCERGVSLNAHEDHRAVVITVELDAKGNVEKTTSERALIHSRAQLTYPGVSAHLEGRAPIDKDDQGQTVPKEVKDQLAIFQALGSVLQKKADARGVVSPERRETRIGLNGPKFELHDVEADLASGLNAQLSILANCAGASMLASTGIPGIEAPGIFRVHPPPGKEKLEALGRLISSIVDLQSAPPDWKWKQGEMLSEWVERIRVAPTNDRQRQLSRALQSQVLSIQVASEYSRKPELHSGLMVEGYGRFTAPMREVVGLLSHATLVQLDSLKRVRALGVPDAELKPLWDHMLLGAIVSPAELTPARAALAARAVGLENLRGPALLKEARALLADLAGAPPLTQAEAGLVETTVNKALGTGNSSRMKQKQCENAAQRLLFDDLFLSDLGGAPLGNPNAPVRQGFVISATPGRVIVALSNPDVEVKLGREDIGETLVLERDGAAIRYRRKDGTECVVCIGAEVEIRASYHDGEKLHFNLID